MSLLCSWIDCLRTAGVVDVKPLTEHELYTARIIPSPPPQLWISLLPVQKAMKAADTIIEVMIYNCGGRLGMRLDVDWE